MIRKPSAALACLSAAVMLTACGRPGPGPQAGGPPPMATKLFVSPAGEPLRETPSMGGAPLARWFAQADSDGDGALGYAELARDFENYFAALDADADGVVGPDEVRRYEQEIFPEISGRGVDGDGGGNGGDFGERDAMGGGDQRRGPPGGGAGGGPPEGMSGSSGGPGGGMRGRGRPAPERGAASLGLLPIYHPLLAADTDLDHSITADEFMAAAKLRYNGLVQLYGTPLTLENLSREER